MNDHHQRCTLAEKQKKHILCVRARMQIAFTLKL